MNYVPLSTLIQKIKSPWKRLFCTAFPMAEVGRGGQRIMTIRLDTYPDKQSFSRSATCQSYGLIAGQIVRIVRWAEWKKKRTSKRKRQRKRNSKRKSKRRKRKELKKKE